MLIYIITISIMIILGLVLLYYNCY